jgi:cobalamin synthase
MKSKKKCCRIFPVILILLSAIVAAAIWYFEEGVHSFRFLTDKNEIFNFLGTVLFTSILPVGIFYLATEREGLKNKARGLALLGFLPALILLIYILIG